MFIKMLLVEACPNTFLKKEGFDMNNTEKNNAFLELIKQHPKIATLTGSGSGLLLLVFIDYFSDKVNFSIIVEWISKLKDLIKNNTAVIFIFLAMLAICITICTYKWLSDKGKIKKKLIEEAGSIAKNDSSISEVTVENKPRARFSLVIKREKTENKAENELPDNIVPFRRPNESEG